MILSPRSSAATDDKQKKTYFTLFDFDDTSVSCANDKIKNAHLLLPIMLFQSRALNQHLGILTNRSPSDVIGYPVQHYQHDISHFGISILDDHIVFGGGANGQRIQKDFSELDSALKIIQAQIESLKLTEAGQALARQLPNLSSNSVTGPVADLISAKYRGKNYSISDFLNRHFNEENRQYRFQSGTCDKDDLVIVMVDDLETIAEEVKVLGSGFIGIKASEGGKPPKLGENPGDYYQDNYLIELAKKIGFAAYANSVLKNPLSHSQDDVLLQVAALLYVWHVKPKKVTLGMFYKFEEILSAEQFEKIAKMLEYISLYGNKHPDAHYNEVSSLVEIFQRWSDDAFLNSVVDQLLFVKAKIAKARNLDDEMVQAEPKKKGIGSLIKTFSSRSSLSAATKESAAIVKQEQIQQIENLRVEEKILTDRLEKLTLSLNPILSKKAAMAKQQIGTEGSFVLLQSSDLSSSSTESLSERRRSFTPLQSVKAEKPIFVSQTELSSTSAANDKGPSDARCSTNMKK